MARFARGVRETYRKRGGQSCTVVCALPGTTSGYWTVELRALFCSGSYTVARWTVPATADPQRRVLGVATFPGAEGYELAVSSANTAPSSAPDWIDVDMFLSDVAATGVIETIHGGRP